MIYPRNSLRTAVLYLLLLSSGCAQQQQEDIVVDGDAQCVHCPEYVAATAAEKEGIIMGKIMESEYETIPDLKGLCDVDFDWRNTVDFSNQFDRFSDERSPGMKRFFHLQVAVASIEFDTKNGTNHNFTGVFRGAESGVLAFSPLAPLLTSGVLVNNFIGTFPISFGIKLFRDFIHSANILTGESNRTLAAYAASRNFWDLPDFNIFSRPGINLPGIGDNGPVFGATEKFSGVLSTADAASYDVKGREELDPKAPIMVHFEPNPLFKVLFGRVDELNFRQWLKDNEDSFQEGTVLYTAYTTVNKETKEASLCVDENGAPLADQDTERICPDQELLKLGDVKLTSRFYASQWADDKLFFQHTRACPKDQAVCADFPQDALTQPYPSFADEGDDSVVCLSDDAKDGEVSGIAPDCPDGSFQLSGYCFPGNHRKVEATQISQCPFMNNIDDYILGTTPVEPNDLDCSALGQAQTDALGLAVSGISSVIRWWENLFG